MNKIFCLLLLYFGLVEIVWAQDSGSYLSPEEAVRSAMENNFSAAISEKNTRIAQESYLRGRSVFMPNLSVAVNRNWTVTNSELSSNDGAIRTVDNGKGNAWNYGFNLNYTLFDGFGMFRSYDRLNYQFQASRLYEKEVKTNLKAEVLQAYYSHTLQQQRLKVWESTLQLSQQRLRLANDRYELGKASKQEYLAAQVDYNADKAAKLNQEEARLNAQYLLNRLIGREPGAKLQTLDTLAVPELDYPEGALNNNPTLVARKMEQQAANTLIEEQNAQLYPNLSFNLGYNSFDQTSPAGFFIFSNGNNLSYGLTASWTIFGGFYTRRSVQISRLQSELFNLNTQAVEQNLMQAEADALAAYNTSLERLNLEQQSVALAKENTALTLDRYKEGIITSLELRIAQQNEQQARLRLLNAIYDIKSAQIELQRIRGEL